MSRRLFVLLIVVVAGYFGWNAIKAYLTGARGALEWFSEMPSHSTAVGREINAGRHNTWEPVGGPGGGYPRALRVASDDQGNVFYEVLENGLFRYRNEEWTLITTSFEGQVFNDFALLPVDVSKHVLYLATSNGLFSSSDEGDHWTDLDSDAFGRRAWRVAVAHGRDTTRILVLSDSGLFQRTENGPWVKALLPLEAAPPFNDVSLIKELDGSFTALVAAATGVFRSKLSEVRWESISAFHGKLLHAFPKLDVSPGEAFAVTYEPHYYYWHYFHLYRTIDGGQTWSAVGDRRDLWTQGLARALVTDIVDAPENGSYALSTDEGKSWTSIRLEGVFGASIVAIPPTWWPNGRFYSTTYDGQVLEIDTVEKGWRFASSQPPASCVRKVAVLYDRGATPILIAAGANGFYVSVDRGASWNANVVGLDNTDLLAVAISPEFDKDKTILVGTSSGLFSMKWGAAAWKTAGKPLADRQVGAITYSPAFASDRSVYAGTDQGVFRSTDGGQKWQAVANSLDGTKVNAMLAQIEAGHVKLYAATVRGLYLSDDRGDSWQIENGVPQLNTLTLYRDESQSQIWIGNADGLFSWTPGKAAQHVQMGTSFNSVSSVISISSLLIAGTIGGGAYCSSDGGYTWLPMHSELNHQQILDLTTSREPSPVLFAGTTDRGVLRYEGLPNECTVGKHP